VINLCQKNEFCIRRFRYSWHSK